MQVPFPSAESVYSTFPLTRDEILDFISARTEVPPVKGHFLTRVLMAAICGLVRALSWKSAYWLGGIIGRVLYAFKVRRDIALTNLNIAFGDEKTTAEKDEIYRRSLLNFGHQVINYVRIPLMDERFWTDCVSIENEDALRRAYNQGKGVVFVYMHFGPWEMAGGKIGHCGYPLSVVAKSMKNPVVNRFAVKARTDMSLGCIRHRDVMPRILEGLRRGEGVVMVIDQNMKRSQGVFVEWLGRVASTVRSASWIVRESGAPVISGFARQTGPCSFEMTIVDEIPWIPHTDPTEELVVNTQNYARVLERAIRQYPEEWFWLHRRWKVQPEGVADPYQAA